MREPSSRGSVVLGVGLLCLAALALCCVAVTAVGRARHPQFRSVPTTVKTSENDTVHLPCYVENLGTNVVRWWWNERLVADSSNRSLELPPRMKLWPNNTLQVSDLRPEDTGDYTCQVLRPQPWGPIQQKHAIEVIYPPAVLPIPESGELEVALGDELQMACEVSGVPRPIVTWFYKGDEMLLLDHRPRLRFTVENRSQAGTYTCSASNGVGESATADIEVTVLFPPEVKTDRRWVHASPDNRVELACNVIAHPEAKVTWLKDGYNFTLDTRVFSFSHDQRHSLVFRKLVKSDFGHYTCRATNRLGSGQEIIHLSGVAYPAVFKTESQVVPEDNFTLIWEVESLSPIIEYRLLFRKYNSSQQGRWAELVIPADVGLFAPGQLHSKAYTLSGLAAATVYEATLLSRNTYGWSKPSSVLRFATEGADLEQKPLVEENILQHETNLFPGDISSSHCMPCPEVAAILNEINDASLPLLNISLLIAVLTILLV
ncbi:hypothetical protein R5R35_006581 [Gryllus longicercus]|uniref:Uncharacterized protein n=1 Tax=Gryllus longicercus TaxID=2509291 RepID=A0AAN9VPY2_9ORTH